MIMGTPIMCDMRQQRVVCPVRYLARYYCWARRARLNKSVILDMVGSSMRESRFVVPPFSFVIQSASEESAARVRLFALINTNYESLRQIPRFARNDKGGEGE